MLMATPMVAVTTSARTTVDEVGSYIIRGRVSGADGQMLVGATVRVPGTTRSVGTNSKGEFELTLKQGGMRELQVSHIGYATAVTSVEASTHGQPISIVLQPTADQLHEAVVTGARTERPLADVPVITRVITQAEIERINPQDFNKLLEYALPGIQFASNHMSLGPTITYQGMSSKLLAFLIDGERISGEGSDHNIDYSRINVDEIERIEVIRGAASTLYDSNATAGVINIITKKGRRPIEALLNTRYAGWQGEKYNLALGVNRKGWSSYTTFGYRHRNTRIVADTAAATSERIYGDRVTVIKGDTARMSLQGYSIFDVSQRFSYDISDYLKADAKVTYYTNALAQAPKTPYKDRYNDVAVNAKLHYLLNPNHRFDLAYLYDNYTKERTYTAKDSTTTRYRNRHNNIRLSYTGTIGAHTLSLGSELDHEHLRHYFFGFKNTQPTRSRTKWAIYAQEHWSILDNLHFVAGIRADKTEGRNMRFTPKASLLYRPIDVITLRANYAEGYRVPTLKELYQHYNQMGHMDILGNENLKDETSRMFSLSAEYNKDGLNLTLSAFKNFYRHRIGYTIVAPYPNGYGYALKYANIDNSRTTGLEATARYRTTYGLGVHAAYNFIDDHQEINGYNTSTVRPHSIAFGADYRRRIGQTLAQIAFTGQWSSALDTYAYVRKSKSNPEAYYTRNHYDARTLCTLNLSATLPHGIKAGFIIDNIFNYRDKASNANIQVPSLGRSYVATLTLNLADTFGW